MTVVQNTVQSGAGVPAVGANVLIELVSAANMPGFLAGATVGAVVRLVTDVDGMWSADLTPNADYLPAGTHYAVTEVHRSGRRQRYTIMVPAEGGPLHVRDVLVTAPASPPVLVPVEGGNGGPVAWTDVTGKPSTFPPATHTHAQADVTGLAASLTAKADAAGTTAALDGKADATATTAALALKADASALAAKADASTMTTALAGKAATTHTHAQADVTGLATTIGARLLASSNLADVANVSTARTNLGLGGAALLAVGQTAGTVAAGDDARFASGGGAAQLDHKAAPLGLQLAVLGPYEATSAALSLGSGLLVMCRVWVPSAMTLTALGAWMRTAGITAAGANGLAIYDAAGTLLGQTVDMSADMAQADRYVEKALLAPVALTANTTVHFAALTHFSGGNPSVSGRIVGTNLVAINGIRPSVYFPGQATFPASVTLASGVVNDAAYSLYGR